MPGLSPTSPVVHSHRDTPVLLWPHHTKPSSYGCPQGGTALGALLTFCPCGPGSPGSPVSPVSPCPEGKYQHQMQPLLPSPVLAGLKTEL